MRVAHHNKTESLSTKTPRRRSLSFAAAVLLLTATAIAALPSSADARGRGGRRGVTVVRVGGFYNPYFYGGFGYYPYYSPFYGSPALYRAPEGGLPPAAARAMDLGALDLKVKPGKAEVWVDGEYVGPARSFDGYPSYLWLKSGRHEIVLYREGYQTFEQTIRVQPGAVVDLKVKLLEGPSEPPAQRR